MGKTVIGLTGSFGSGCTTHVLPSIGKRGYKRSSLSALLREEYSAVYPDHEDPPREALQDFGNRLRLEKGCDYLARRGVEEITNGESDKWIVDSIRNPSEVEHLRSAFHEGFFLFGVYAHYETRWNRVKHFPPYNENEALFKQHDKRDADERLEHGQRVRDCYIRADIVILNDRDHHAGSRGEQEFDQKIGNFIDLVERKEPFVPSQDDAMMAIAYANSLRSSCVKRKVGAVVVDKLGNIISSGYNEVPVGASSCMDVYGMCYRDKLKEETARDIANVVHDAGVIEQLDPILSRRFKILDYCRSVHAEENTILNIARFGSRITEGASLLYTTTYPCNLCANKIVQVGIGTVVYLEPYPMEEAREVLTSKSVEQIPFEGVTFNGYFRFRWGCEI